MNTRTCDTADPIWEPRVKDAVETQLAAKGWTKVPADGDVVVGALLITRPEQLDSEVRKMFKDFPPGTKRH